VHTAAMQLIRAEQELTWFFSAGQVAFERSTFGGSLERASMFSVTHSMPTVPVYDDEGNVIARECGITAWPTAESRAVSGYVPESETLTRFAHVSRLLKRVEQRSRQSAQVLELLYGDLGQRWATNEPWGRLGSLFHVTSKGRQLLDEARAAKGAIDLPDTSRMEVIAAVQKAQPNVARGQALAYCQTQARALEKLATTTWVEVSRQQRAR
jgi:hypothetical protein